MLRTMEMTDRRWLILLAVVGMAIFALSFVNAWILHDREVRGEGYRHARYLLSAWRGVGPPVLTVAALAALAVAVAAVVGLRRSVPPGWLVAGSVVALGIIASVAVPVEQHGHASSVELSPALLFPIGLLLGLLMVAAALAVARPSGRALVAAFAAILVLIPAAAAGRWWTLLAAEGTGRHWTDGSYTRAATGGEPTETLTIRDARVAIGDRWQGSWEWSGWTVVIDNDPACPGSRGAYHAHGINEEDLRFVKVVDTCEDGARGTDLETGIWYRDP